MANAIIMENRQEKLDLREFGAPGIGESQVSDRRLFLQLQVFSGCKNPAALIEVLETNGVGSVLYDDLNDPTGIGLLLIAEEPTDILTQTRVLLMNSGFSNLDHCSEMTMIGRTYASGREQNLNEALFEKPLRNVMNPEMPWAIWYPLRRKPEFYLLSGAEQGRILGEHGMLGRTYAEMVYAADVRLACFGLDRLDNELVIGLVGPELYALSRLVQDMRKTQQTGKYIESLGPFFVGKVRWQSAS